MSSLSNGILLLFQLLLELFVSNVGHSGCDEIKKSVLVERLQPMFLNGSKLAWPCVGTKDNIRRFGRRLANNATDRSLSVNHSNGTVKIIHPPNRLARSVASSRENALSSPVKTNASPARQLGSAASGIAFEPGAAGPAATFAAFAAQLIRTCQRLSNSGCEIRT